MVTIQYATAERPTEEVLARAQRPTRPGGAHPALTRVTRGIHRWAMSTRLALARAI